LPLSVCGPTEIATRPPWRIDLALFAARPVFGERNPWIALSFPGIVRIFRVEILLSRLDGEVLLVLRSNANPGGN